MGTPPIHKICQQCGKEFIAKNTGALYCSKRCLNIARRHRKRDKRLKNTTAEVRELERQALLDKCNLSLTEAAKLLGMSRNTLYKIMRENQIPIKRFTTRTVRISRSDIDKFTRRPDKPEVKLEELMTRQQVMQKYNITYSLFYTRLKRHNIKAVMRGAVGYYDAKTMEKIFGDKEYEQFTQWYTYEEASRLSGLAIQYITEFCNKHKILRRKKGHTRYISKLQWDATIRPKIDPLVHYSIPQIAEKYQLSKSQIHNKLKDNGITGIKANSRVYYPQQEVDNILQYRLSKLQ